VTPFMQGALGYPVLTAGVLLGTRGVGTLISMLVVGRLLNYVEARWLIGVGIVLLIGTLDHMSGFTDQTAGTTIALTSIVQGFGIGLVFVPLSTVAFMSLKPELRTDGTAMLTLVRNIFSSIGISVMIAELTNLTIESHARLVEYVTPFNDALKSADVASVLNLATDQGRALMDLIVTQQASIIAYAGDFRLLMWLAIAALPLILFVGSSRAARSGAADGERAAHAMD
jgi:MFS transporter, DHA2 family, multidrug resistance protein